MLTIHVWPKRLKEFLLTHPLYKSPGVWPKAYKNSAHAPGAAPRGRHRRLASASWYSE